jgi:hypothetical protein
MQLVHFQNALDHLVEQGFARVGVLLPSHSLSNLRDMHAVELPPIFLVDI